MPAVVTRLLVLDLEGCLATFRIHDLFAVGDRVALRATWRAAGYHESGLVFLRLEHGRIAERWSAYRAR